MAEIKREKDVGVVHHAAAGGHQDQDAGGKSQSCSDGLMPRVAGTICEKLLYYVVLAAAAVLFLFTLVSIIHEAATGTVTDFEASIADEVPFPAVFVCYGSQTGRSHLDNGNVQASTDDCPAGITAVRSQKKFQYGDYATDCRAVQSSSSPLARKLRQLLHSTGTLGDNPTCVVVNEDGRVKGSSDSHTYMVKEWITDYYANVQYDDVYLLVGFLDPGVPFEAQAANYYAVETDIVNARTHFMFTVDTYVDKSRSFGFPGADGPPKIRKYNIQSFTRRDRETGPSSYNRVRGQILVEPAGFLTRTITTRRKTFSEVWSEVGGAWATAVLLVTFLFVNKEVQGKTSTDAVEEVKVFRFRVPSSRKQLVEDMASFIQLGIAAEDEAARAEEGKGAAEAGGWASRVAPQ